MVQPLRAEGRSVLLHSVRAKSRVPVVARAYGLRLHTVPTTLIIAEVESVLLGARMNPTFRDALEAAPVAETRVARDRPRPVPAGGRGRSPRQYRTRGDWPEERAPTSADGS